MNYSLKALIIGTTLAACLTGPIVIGDFTDI